ncbi:MAG TPA: hypothetical protein PLD54_04470 [Candidatus Levybacteria bacterium]|nr:hypothetical protein [Candidatus Levybacteria bacterium]
MMTAAAGQWGAVDDVPGNEAQFASAAIVLRQADDSGMCLPNTADTLDNGDGLLPGEAQPYNNCKVTNSGSVPFVIRMHVTGATAEACTDMLLLAESNSTTFGTSGNTLTDWSTEGHGTLPGGLLSHGSSRTIAWAVQAKPLASQSYQAEKCTYTVIVSGSAT